MGAFKPDDDDAFYLSLLPYSAYSAPEATVGSENVTKATDVYALGVIFYEVDLYDCSPFANVIIQFCTAFFALELGML